MCLVEFPATARARTELRVVHPRNDHDGLGGLVHGRELLVLLEKERGMACWHHVQLAQKRKHRDREFAQVERVAEGALEALVVLSGVAGGARGTPRPVSMHSWPICTGMLRPGWT